MVEPRKFVAPEIVYGDGALSLVGRYARNFGARKVLVVTDPGIVRSSWTTHVLRSLEAEGIPAAVFQDISPNPRESEVTAGVTCYEENGCDVIVAVGGGSPMDCAKGIGISHTNGRDVLEFEGVDEVPMPGPPLICIPTTAGTSADVSQFAIIADTTRRVKIAIISKTMVPDVSLIDPCTTTTMDPELTAATGMDALVHAIEAYVSNASSRMTDLHARAAIPLLALNLVPAIKHPDDIAYRNEMMTGSLLAGLAFSNASLGLVHAMAHSMGGLLDLPHGLCNALLLDHVIEFNYRAVPDRYDAIGEALGLNLCGMGDDDRLQALKDAIVTLRGHAGIHATIADLGVTREDIPILALTASMDPCLATNPRVAGVQDIERIFENAL